MDTKALQFNCRFSLPPNSLGYCGKDTAPERFKKCVTKGSCQEIEAELEKFIVLNPYLETLSEITGKPKFSYENIEAYWLGNDVLKKAKLKDYQKLLDSFIKQGVPAGFVDELRVKIPKVFIPHHLFQVLHVGVGKASGSVQFNLCTINNCMIRWGEVTRIQNNTLMINLHSLDDEETAYKLVRKETEAKYLSDFLPNIKIGDTVAVHWGQAVKVMTFQEIEKLSFWTEEVLKSL